MVNRKVMNNQVTPAEVAARIMLIAAKYRYARSCKGTVKHFRQILGDNGLSADLSMVDRALILLESDGYCHVIRGEKKYRIVLQTIRYIDFM